MDGWSGSSRMVGLIRVFKHVYVLHRNMPASLRKQINFVILLIRDKRAHAGH